MLGFIIGIFAGGVFGTFTMALMKKPDITFRILCSNR